MNSTNNRVIPLFMKKKFKYKRVNNAFNHVYDRLYSNSKSKFQFHFLEIDGMFRENEAYSHFCDFREVNSVKIVRLPQYTFYINFI